jgi:glycerophosphoryl diester phosphodiesterase
MSTERRHILGGGIGLGLGLMTNNVSAQSKVQDKNVTTPLIIAHRGASGYQPEHTLEAYSLAIRFEADYIEPDLVATKDGVLICRHEPFLSGTTNILDLPQFADRRRTLTLDGTIITDFFACDFTLAEIKTLRARQSFSDRDQSVNDKFLIPTFAEVIHLAKTHKIGLYPEIKHPYWHALSGHDLGACLLRDLKAQGLNHKGASVFIQSFEPESLKKIRPMTPLPLVQLVDGGDVSYRDGSIAELSPFDWHMMGLTLNYSSLLTPDGLKAVKAYADVVAPWKRYLLKAISSAELSNPTEADCEIIENKSIIDNAHALGLKVHTWTLRNEPKRLAKPYRQDPHLEFIQLFNMGIDGVFTDFADTGIAARRAWQTS